MTDEATTLRRCIGSKRFSIEPHEAPVEDFPARPSQEDGLGRMCRTHWNQYTAGLARDAKARKAAEADGAPSESVPAVAAPKAAQPEPARTRAPRARRKAEPVVEEVQEPAAG